MERSTNKGGNNNGKQILTMSELLGGMVGRMLLASRLGMDTYSGNRDIYRALGYPKEITFEDFLSRYKRQDIAGAIIDRPVQATWQGLVLLIESNKSKETKFEKAWRQLDKNLKLKSRLARLDRLTGIGRYGILVLGLDDVRSIDGWQQPVQPGKRTLHYVRPLSEGSAKILEYEKNPTSLRYGFPLYYEINAFGETSKISKSIKLHYSRVIHVTDNQLESDVFGESRLESVYNRLIDIEKLVGGDAEMFWRGARPGYYGKLDPDYQATEAFKTDLKQQIDEYENDLRRILINEGVDLKALAQQIADPSSHLDSLLKLISSRTGIPVRILVGSERGELASSEDRSEWLSYIQARREEHAEPNIIRPFVNRLIEYEILPEPKDDYVVKWSELFAQSEKMRVDIGRARANAIAEYTRNPMAVEIIPPSVFMEKCLGLSEDDVEWVYSVRDSQMQEEVEHIKELDDVLESGKKEQDIPKQRRSNEEKGITRKRRELPDASV